MSAETSPYVISMFLNSLASNLQPKTQSVLENDPFELGKVCFLGVWGNQLLDY